jgi:hypothetical protein
MRAPTASPGSPAQRRYVLGLWCLVLLLSTGTVRADDDVLLAQITFAAGDGGNLTQFFPPATAFAPILVMGNDPQNPAACIGCNGAVQFAMNRASASAPLGATLTAATQPGWNNFFADLSGSADSLFWTSRCFFPTTAAGAACGSAAGGAPQSLEFGAAGAFSTRSVEFIDVLVSRGSYRYEPHGPRGGSLYDFNYAVTWQLWGDGAPVGGLAAPVPLPATLWLLLTGLWVLAWQRCKAFRPRQLSRQ